MKNWLFFNSKDYKHAKEKAPNHAKENRSGGLGIPSPAPLPLE